jgi:hypothetical protein
MGGSCLQGSQGPVDMSSHRRCLVHLVLDQRLQPWRAVVRKPSPLAWHSASALTGVVLLNANPHLCES